MFSLCILTHNNVVGVRNLVTSLWDIIDEVVIGDNSNIDEVTSELRHIADIYFKIDDMSLWANGFGPAKQKIIAKATNDWVIIADPDEKWVLNYKVVRNVKNNDYPVYKTKLKHGDNWVEHGRIINKQQMRLIGIIHESPYHKATRQHWSKLVPDEHFATIIHHPHDDSRYQLRKQILYDNLIFKAYKNPALRHGIDRWWFEVYMNGLLKQHWKPVGFDDWQKI